jgi:hypothetical protein
MHWIKTSDVRAVTENSEGTFTILFCDGLRLKDVTPWCAEGIIRDILSPKPGQLSPPRTFPGWDKPMPQTDNQGPGAGEPAQFVQSGRMR